MIPTNEIWDNMYKLRGQIPRICYDAAKANGYGMCKNRGRVWLTKDRKRVEWFPTWRQAYDYLYRLVHKEVE
jgi:hypothetical protein